MRYSNNPRQLELFDIFESQMSAIAYQRLKKSFHAVFRHIILHLMPVAEIGETFHPVIGRPTKELYSMAGLVLLKEFHNWTTADATDAYLFDIRVHYALNLAAGRVSFCERTLQRYQKLLDKDEVVQKIFNTVTEHLINELELKIDKQRLDSTHVFSDMAKFGRTKLMGTTMTQFLTQLKRHHQDLYEGLPETIRTRYSKKIDILFAEFKNDQKRRSLLRQEVAEEMYELIKTFDGNNAIENMNTFKTLVKVFGQQCELSSDIKVSTGSPGKSSHSPDDNDSYENPTQVPAHSQRHEISATQEQETKIMIKKSPGGDVIQNPSDPDATYNGHKGQGYQIQLTETCNPDNEVQLIISAIAQTAAQPDSAAVKLVLDDLREKNLLPDKLLADTLYGSDENSENATRDGVKLISPVPGKAPNKPPHKITPKHERLRLRREEQQTQAWRDDYKVRAQEEGIIGCIKRKTGMVRLRYRGAPRMFSSMILKTLGWNISQTHRSAKIQQKLAQIIR